MGRSWEDHGKIMGKQPTISWEYWIITRILWEVLIKNLSKNGYLIGMNVMGIVV